MAEWPVRGTRWRPVLLAFLVSVALRLYGIGEWSLWEDEETTLYFWYHPQARFPRNFPVYFLILGHVFRYTGCSVLVGRLLSAVIGILSLFLIYTVARRFTSRHVALTALVAVAISPGHVFWSQSIRSYGLVICLQMVAIWLFLEGIRRKQALMVVFSLAPIALAMKTHVSAVLIMPVFATYLVGLEWRRGYATRTAIVAACFLAATLVVLLRWAPTLASMLSSGTGFILPSARDPVHVLVTAVFYFGLPAIVLATIGAWRQRAVQGDEVYFFGLLAVMPGVILLTLAALNLINVTYYYGLIALVGIAVLAGYGVEALRTARSRYRLAAMSAALLYYLIVLGAYFGPAYGDRPRWREAAGHIAHARHTRADDGAIYAQVPGVIAFYLGVPPSQTMGHPLVNAWTVPSLPRDDQPGWFIAEERLVTGREQASLGLGCAVSARFPSRMLMRDRTVIVYRCVSR